MANKIEEKKEIFNQKRQEYKDMKDKKSNYSKRIEDSKINIINLEEEREELKAKRPTMLAENEDISELNQRLKDIDDEIEINKDIDLIELLSKTKYGSSGIGGIITRGTMYVGFPR